MKPFADEIAALLSQPLELPTPPSSPNFVKKVPISEVVSEKAEKELTLSPFILYNPILLGFPSQEKSSSSLSSDSDSDEVIHLFPYFDNLMHLLVCLKLFFLNLDSKGDT